MDINNLEVDLLKAIQNFTSKYRDELQKHELDAETSEALYNLGACIKHTFDSFEEAIIKHLKDK